MFANFINGNAMRISLNFMRKKIFISIKCLHYLHLQKYMYTDVSSTDTMSK